MASVLIIYAHPPTKGHNSYVRERVEREFKLQQVEYELVDLYAAGFDPVLPAKEHYTAGNHATDAVVKDLQAKVAAAQHLVFVYPIWWGSGPAVLKGFFDRVFTNRFAFRYKKLPFPIFGLQARPVGLFKGKKAVLFTTSGAVGWTIRLFGLSRYFKGFRKDILGFCGVRARTYNIDAALGVDERMQKRIRRNVERGLRWLLR